MSYKPPVPCKVPGCPMLVYNGNVCQLHKQRVTKDISKRHESTRWLKYRKWFLDKFPLCAYCLKDGRVEPATVVDHKIRVESDLSPLFWQEENLQSLCEHHHNEKTGKGL